MEGPGVSRASAGARRVTIVMAIAAAATGIAVAPALAPPDAHAAKGKKKKGELRTATATATAAGAFVPATAVANCPKGTKVLAGGYTTSLPSIPNNWLNIYESQRGSQRSWRVSGVQVFAGSATLTAYAYCQPLKAKVVARSAQAALPATANSTAVVQASCPRGTKVLSGGFVTPPANSTDAAYVSRSIAAGGSRWVVDATRLGGAAAGNFTANVYCAGIPKVKGRTATAPVVPPVGSTHTATTGKCPKGLGTGGGGFATSTPVGGLMNAALVYETRLAGAGWSSSATPSSGTTSITLLTAAYCR